MRIDPSFVFNAPKQTPVNETIPLAYKLASIATQAACTLKEKAQESLSDSSLEAYGAGGLTTYAAAPLAMDKENVTPTEASLQTLSLLAQIDLAQTKGNAALASHYAQELVNQGSQKLDPDLLKTAPALSSLLAQFTEDSSGNINVPNLSGQWQQNIIPDVSKWLAQDVGSNSCDASNSLTSLANTSIFVMDAMQAVNNMQDPQSKAMVQDLDSSFFAKNNFFMSDYKPVMPYIIGISLYQQHVANVGGSSQADSPAEFQQRLQDLQSILPDPGSLGLDQNSGYSQSYNEFKNMASAKIGQTPFPPAAWTDAFKCTDLFKNPGNFSDGENNEFLSFYNGIAGDVWSQIFPNYINNN